MKKFIFLVSFIILVFSFSCSCYADDFVVQLPDLPTRDGYPYYIIYKRSDTTYYLRLLTTIDNNVSIGYYSNGHNHYLIGACPQLLYIFNTDSTEWRIDSSFDGQPIISCVNGSCPDGHIVYCNFSVSYNGNEVLSKHEFSTGGFDEPVEEPSILDGIGVFFDSLFDKLGNWFTNLINFVKSIPQLIIDGFKDLFVFLFVPGDNLFHDFKDLIEEKFGIFKQIKDITMDLSTLDSSESAPNFSITYAGHTLNIIDFSMFTQYRSMIHNIIILISGFYFVNWLIVSAPSIVMGQSVGEESAKQ